MNCNKCDKFFHKKTDLIKHNERNVNCQNRCPICLKYYSSKRTLKNHESIVCKKKFECQTCYNIYTTKNILQNHKCISSEIQNDKVNNILRNMPNDKQININNINIYNNEINEINNNEINEINNNEINEINNKNIEINHNSKNKILNNFLTTTPVNFSNFEYKVRKDLGALIPKFIKMGDYTEELADQYMYEEKKFKQVQNEDIIRKYDKEPLQVEGMKQFFTELQKDVENRNVVIKKSKSGKCYVYEKEWEKKQLKEITKKICNKVCDTLFDIETSMNHFMRLILGSQPKRYTELKKHIHKEIMKAGKIVNNELIE